jgi:hypothetical protein
VKLLPFLGLFCGRQFSAPWHQPARFYNCLQTQPEATIILIPDLVEADLLPENPYMTLMARLMAAYQITNINLPPSGEQKPSELLAGDAAAVSPWSGEQ